MTSWDGVRAEFRLDPDYAHLSMSLVSSHPRPVREAIERHRAGLDANPALYFHRRDELVREVLDRAGAYVGADPGSIALTDSTTTGLAVVLTGFRLRPGEEVLSTAHEHYAASELIRFKVAASGARHRVLRLYRDPRRVTEEEVVANLRAGISDETRLLVLTWVHSGTGVKLPLARLGEVVAEVNRGRAAGREVLVCVDGVHGFGVEDFRVGDLGCDFFAAGCHKWLFGPRGTGLLWGSPRGWAAVDPISPSFDVEVFWPWYLGSTPDGVAPPGRFHTPGGFPAFEHRWALAEAFGFHAGIGRAAVAARTHELTARCLRGLSELPGVTVRTPADPALSAGMVCFDVAGAPPDQVVERLLDARVVAGQTPYRDSAVRFAPSVVNTPEDVDRGVAALAALVPALAGTRR
ncbi:aminotransferase class V-fold PLP-dependent enzyme [Actinosynnema sp. NPDC059335]|uniref:aminotransferase class V-fold PLP-dependent enzyme n=1 Tax=Actinosynnema sp. NPDC059335 TaxID=3346804 RepID=UPI00366F43AD